MTVHPVIIMSSPYKSTTSPSVVSKSSSVTSVTALFRVFQLPVNICTHKGRKRPLPEEEASVTASDAGGVLRFCGSRRILDDPSSPSSPFSPSCPSRCFGRGFSHFFFLRRLESPGGSNRRTDESTARDHPTVTDEPTVQPSPRDCGRFLSLSFFELLIKMVQVTAPQSLQLQKPTLTRTSLWTTISIS